jgi:hypothetical protein
VEAKSQDFDNSVFNAPEAGAFAPLACEEELQSPFVKHGESSFAMPLP